MGHLLEPATTGRARCRACAQPIAKGTLRFGERIPNPFGDGEATLWFHPLCAAHRRPEALLATLTEAGTESDTVLLATARRFSSQRRLPRLDGAERAPSGQAKCRSCHEPIARDTWRIRISYFEDGRFSPGGFVHLGCRGTYFETEDLAEALLLFSPALDEAQREALRHALDGPLAG